MQQPNQDLLDRTIEAAARDQQTVDRSGRSTKAITEGLTIRPLTTHVDDRGSVMEMFDPRWNWHPDPVVFAYMFTIRPGVVKGWGLHKEHEDRYCLMQGELELILYDVRPDSSTCGQICKIYLSETSRCLINIPQFVWHADRNIGGRDAVVVNFPTIQYDHTNPDKYRLPLDTPMIPYKFEGISGGW